MEELLGKEIIGASVDGFGVELTLSDGTVFNYEASDGGMSTWSVSKKEHMMRMSVDKFMDTVKIAHMAGNCGECPLQSLSSDLCLPVAHSIVGDPSDFMELVKVMMNVKGK